MNAYYVPGVFGLVLFFYTLSHLIFPKPRGGCYHYPLTGKQRKVQSQVLNPGHLIS